MKTPNDPGDNRTRDLPIFDVEYIYGFIWWGVCKQSRWRHSVTEPSEYSGYVLLWQRYDNNKMVAMRYYGNVSFCCWRCVYWACYRCILHLQQYSHRLNLFFCYSASTKWATGCPLIPFHFPSSGNKLVFPLIIFLHWRASVQAIRKFGIV